jgi:hypothetical protein
MRARIADLICAGSFDQDATTFANSGLEASDFCEAICEGAVVSGWFLLDL